MDNTNKRMTDTNRILFSSVFLSWPFLLALCLLLLNDWYLKAIYSSWFTGKLSDFAGIYMVALLLYGLLPKHWRLLSLLIGVGFIYWKSPHSDFLISLINSMTPLTYARVVDYSDLIALVMLPVARHTLTWNMQLTTTSTISRVIKWPLMLVSFVAVMGTSIPKEPPQVAAVRPTIVISQEDIDYAHKAVLEVVKKYDLEPDPWPCDRYERYHQIEMVYCVGYSTKDPTEMRKDIFLIVQKDAQKIDVLVEDSENYNTKKALNMFDDVVDALKRTNIKHHVEIRQGYREY